MPTIISGSTTLTPLLVDGYRSTRRAGNLIHGIVASAWPAVTLRPAKPRSGQLSLLADDLESALQLEALHAAASPLQLVDGDLPGMNMTYVASGEIILELDKVTLRKWWVRVGFQEIQP